MNKPVCNGSLSSRNSRTDIPKPDTRHPVSSLFLKKGLVAAILLWQTLPALSQIPDPPPRFQQFWENANVHYDDGLPAAEGYSECHGFGVGFNRECTIMNPATDLVTVNATVGDDGKGTLSITQEGPLAALAVGYRFGGQLDFRGNVDIVSSSSLNYFDYSIVTQQYGDSESDPDPDKHSRTVIHGNLKLVQNTVLDLSRIKKAAGIAVNGGSFSVLGSTDVGSSRIGGSAKGIQANSTNDAVLAGIWGSQRGTSSTSAPITTITLGEAGASTTLDIHDLALTSSAAKSMHSYGIYAAALSSGVSYDGTRIEVNSDATIKDISAVAAPGGSAYTAGIMATEKGSDVTVNGALRISQLAAITDGTGAAGANGAHGTNASVFALAATDGGRIQVNDAGQSKDVILEHNLIASGEDADHVASHVTARFMTDASRFEGLTFSDTSDGNGIGQIDLSFARQAYWKVTEDNRLTGTLAFDSGGQVYVGSDRAAFASLNHTPARFTPTTLSVNRLQGNGGTLFLRVDLNGGTGDKVVIDKGSEAGSAQYLTVRSQGISATVEEMQPGHYLVWDKLKTAQDPATGSRFALANPGSRVDAGLYLYELDSRASMDSQGGTEWFLKRSADKPYSPSGEAVIALAGMGSQASMWWSQLSDLRKRLGEVRYGSQEGLWIRGIAGKDRVSGFAGTSFDQDVYGLDLGYDRIARRTADDTWLLGGNLRIAYADQQTQDTNFSADGSDHAFGASLYATRADEKGYYSDFVLSANHYRQKINTRMLDGTGTAGRFNTMGYGASVEFGRMIEYGKNDSHWTDHWFIEPQAQLSYFWIRGKRFSMDNGMTVRQDDADSLTGRLGLVWGKKFNRHSPDNKDPRYSQFYLKAGVNHEFLGKQTIHVNDIRFSDTLAGTRLYYGAGFDWQWTDDTRLYAQIEREHGHHYTREFEVSAGVKWDFR